MHVRRAIGLTVALALAFATRQAHAWQEAHQTGDDATVVVDAKGEASVTEHLRWHVVRGPLRAIDLANVAPGAVYEEDVPVASGDGRTFVAHAVRRDERTIRIVVDEPHALMRGSFSFMLHSRVDLGAAHALARDGATWRLAWSSPAALDGFENVHTTFDLPAAPEPPRPIVAETGVVDDAAVQTLNRGAERDVLDVVRPHVARGEAASWVLRVDARAFSGAGEPHAASKPPAPTAVEPDRMREACTALLLAAVALAFGLLVAHKDRAFSLRCSKVGATARGLLPLRPTIRAAMAGSAFGAALGVELAGNPTAASAVLAMSMLLACAGRPRAARQPRGRGQWVALAAEEAFRRTRPAGHWLDVGSAAGRRSAVAFLALVVGAVAAVRRFDEQWAWLVAIDAAAFVPLFITGCAAQLPPDGFRSFAPWLGRVFSRLRSEGGRLRVTPWARTVLDTEAVDELRLLVTSPTAMAGLQGLEVGVAWNETGAGWAMAPEVLVRVSASSAAASKLACDLPDAPSMPGRLADERVVRVRPKAPTVSCTVALVRDLIDALAAPASEPPARKPPFAETAARPRGLASPRAQTAAQPDAASESRPAPVL